LAGGVVPEEDLPLLHEAGYARVFTMGTDTREIVDYLHRWWAQKLAAESAP
jgi:methylmalonyl-CoA mutase C-terminal domain/subunit